MKFQIGLTNQTKVSFVDGGSFTKLWTDFLIIFRVSNIYANQAVTPGNIIIDMKVS